MSSTDHERFRKLTRNRRQKPATMNRDADRRPMAAHSRAIAINSLSHPTFSAPDRDAHRVGDASNRLAKDVARRTART
jgi:hypothetical protein